MSKKRYDPSKRMSTAPSAERVAKLLHEGHTPAQVAAALGCTERQVRRAGRRFCERHGVHPLEAFGRWL